MAVKLEVKLLKEETEKTAHNVLYLETNNRGTWERVSQAPITSDDAAAAAITLGLHERLVIEGAADYEVVYNADQATTSIVQKDHEPPPPPPPDPEIDDPEVQAAKSKTEHGPTPRPPSVSPPRHPPPTSPMGRRDR